MKFHKTLAYMFLKLCHAQESVTDERQNERTNVMKESNERMEIPEEIWPPLFQVGGNKKADDKCSPKSGAER